MAAFQKCVFFIALVLSCSVIHACTTSSSARVLRVFKESIRLNEAFKKSVEGTNDVEYRYLRKQVEHYEESTAIPCLRRVDSLLELKQDGPLVDTLFAHALSHENSSDETESLVLATVFVRHHGTFMMSWKKSSIEVRRAVAARLESGWYLIKGKYPLAKQRQIDSQLRQLLLK